MIKPVASLLQFVSHRGLLPEKPQKLWREVCSFLNKENFVYGFLNGFYSKYIGRLGCIRATDPDPVQISKIWNTDFHI